MVLLPPLNQTSIETVNINMFVCLSVQDLSYYCCIELQGDEDKLLACLSQLTSKDTGAHLSCTSSLMHEYTWSILRVAVCRYSKN